MIHDALDGTSGRRVWEIRAASGKPVFVIAASSAAARSWLRGVLEGPGVTITDDALDRLAVTDRGGADRTEIALWHDETRLAPNAPTDTDEQGSA